MYQYVDDTHMILKKIHSQEFACHLNAVDDYIKWMMDGEVVTEVPVEVNGIDVEEEDALVRVERGLTMFAYLVGV